MYEQKRSGTSLGPLQCLVAAEKDKMQKWSYCLGMLTYYLPVSLTERRPLHADASFLVNPVISNIYSLRTQQCSLYCHSCERGQRLWGKMSVSWLVRIISVSGCSSFEIVFNLLKPSGLFTYKRFNIQKFYMVLALRCVFCTDLRTERDFWFIHHWLIGFYNRAGKCLLCGTDWFLI